jgi:probable HAF family extracellular repeat protein
MDRRGRVLGGPAVRAAVGGDPSLPWSPLRVLGQARACLSNPDRSGPAAAANTQETDPTHEETSMASPARPNLGRRLGRRLRLAVAGAAVVTVLTAATAAAAPTPMGAPGDVSGPGAPLALGPMGSNDPEPGSRRNAVKSAAPPGGFIYRKGRYTPLDTLDGRLTGHTGINNRGQIVGSYDADGMTVRGFVRDQRGNYTSFDAAPGAITLAFDINDRGTVAGTYADPEQTQTHGFLRRPNGTVTTIDAPGASNTFVYGTNNRGAVVGSYVDADGREHGFLLERGQMTVIEHPDAPEDPAATNTAASDLNDRGQIVGYYTDANGTYHGYRYDKGRFTRIDPPGTADVAGFATTAPLGINNRGQVVGQSVDAAGVLHGYLWEQGRGFRTIDSPGGANNACAEPPNMGRVCGTIAADINDRGQILLPAPGGFFKGRAVPIGS